MAIINSYPNITPKADDLLLISDTSVEGNPTKTASVNSVLALIPSGSGGGSIANITSSNSNFLTVDNPDGPLVTLNIQTGFVSQGGNTLATTGDIYTFTTTQINNAISNLPVGVTSFACDISNIPAFTENVTTNSSGAVTLTIGRTGGSANQFLRYDGIWATPNVQGMTSWEIAADTGSNEVRSKEKVDFEGSTKITTDVRETSTGEYTLTIEHDTQDQTNTTPGPTAITNGGTFTALSQNVDVDGTGHVTGQTLRTYQLPSVGGVNSVSVTAPVTLGGTSSDPDIGVDLSSKQDLLVSGTNIKTINAQSLLGSGNITISGGGGTGVTGVGVNISDNIPALTVTPTNIASGSSGTFQFGIDSSSGGASEYLDGTGNWSTPSGTSVTLGTTQSTDPGDSVTITASPGSGTTIGVATTTRAGVMSKAQVDKLNGIEARAEVNVQSNWNESDTTSDAFIQNKPTIPSQFTWSLTGDTGTPQTVVSGATIDIASVGDGISTEIDGNTLKISNTSPGTVEEVSVGDTTFISGSTVSGNPITSTGTLKFELRATGTPNSNTFLSGNGNGEWKSLSVSNVFQTGRGLTTDTTTTPDTVEVDYVGGNNVIYKAAAGGAALERTDKVIVNIEKLSNTVQKISIGDILTLSGFAPPTYFSVKGDGSMNNNGNWALNTQGFGTITSAISSTQTSDIVVSFADRTSTSTNYMVNFTISGVTVVGADNYSAGAYIFAKTATSFTIRFTKPETGTGQGVPTATNFILYD